MSHPLTSAIVASAHSPLASRAAEARPVQSHNCPPSAQDGSRSRGAPRASRSTHPRLDVRSDSEEVARCPISTKKEEVGMFLGADKEVEPPTQTFRAREAHKTLGGAFASFVAVD